MSRTGQDLRHHERELVIAVLVVEVVEVCFVAVLAEILLLGSARLFELVLLVSLDR